MIKIHNNVYNLNNYNITVTALVTHFTNVENV